MLRDACRALCSSPPTEVRINSVFPLSAPPSRLPSPWVGHPHPAALPLPGGFPLSSSSAGNAGAKPRAPSLLSISNYGAPKGKHLSGAGLRVALPLPQENSGSPGVTPGGENGSTTCSLGSRPAASAPCRARASRQRGREPTASEL